MQDVFLKRMAQSAKIAEDACDRLKNAVENGSACVLLQEPQDYFRAKQALRKAFVTPVEREDLFLIHAGLLQIRRAAEESCAAVCMLPVGARPEFTREVQILCEAARGITVCCERFHKRKERSFSQTEQALEQALEAVFDARMTRCKKLAKNFQNNVLQTVKNAEFCDRINVLERTLDQTARLLMAAAMKNI